MAEIITTAAAPPPAACSAARFGLSDATLGRLRAVLSAHAPVVRALVFGSRAKGNFRPGSDIDLALDAPDLPFAELLVIEREIDDLLLPYEVDLAVLHQIESPELLDHITRVGQPLWVRP
jgi:predicted nucleotidyltransferase